MLISLVATLIIFFGLKEFDPCVLTQQPDSGSVRKTFGQEHKECFSVLSPDKPTIGKILGMTNVPSLLVIYFLVMLGFSFFYIGFPIHAVRKLDWSVTDAGVFFAYLSLLMVIVQGPILSKLSSLVSDAILTIGGTLVLAAGFAGLYFDSVVEIYAAASLVALGNGLMWPSVMAMLSKVAGGQHQGAVQGAGGSVGAVASIAGLVAAGLLYNWLNSWIFVLAALVVLPAIFITPRLPRSVA